MEGGFNYLFYIIRDVFSSYEGIQLRLLQERKIERDKKKMKVKYEFILLFYILRLLFKNILKSIVTFFHFQFFIARHIFIIDNIIPILNMQ